MSKRLAILIILAFSLFSTAFADYSSDEVLQAAKKNDVSTMKVYISSNANLNCQDKDGFTPLMFASLNNYTELVKLLVSKPGVNLNLKNNYGYSALTLAVVFGNTEIQDILKKAGAKE